MAEISYPFAADSAGGGAQMVSQAQWQKMAHLFGTDRIDTQLVSSTYTNSDLPFGATVVNGTTVSISTGSAYVGGFYYQLTASQTVTIAANSGTTSRIDLIVIRADLVAGSVNLAVIQGQAAASPIPPAVTRNLGGKWELPIYQVNVPASGGALTVASAMTFDMPGHVAVPWNADVVGPMARVGTFVYDMDNNTNDTQAEWFRGRDGFVRARDFGKSKGYSPTLLNMSASLAASALSVAGTWRWVSPNVVYFSARLQNDYDQSLLNNTSWRLGVSLPVPANGVVGQVLTGYLDNPRGTGPSYVQLVGNVYPGSATSNVGLMKPSQSSPSQGLTAFNEMPAGATLYISGTYEANAFGE